MSGDSQNRLLTFEIGSSLFALPIEGVHEVAEIAELACIPTLPRDVAGVINYRGDALPVVRRERLLEPGAGALAAPQHVLVISDRPSSPPCLGLEVDRVLGLVDGAAARSGSGRRAEPVAERRPLDGRHVAGGGCAAPGGAGSEGDRRRTRAGRVKYGGTEMARVLVADDASFMRQMIREIVEAEGHEVVGEASDGDEAVEEWKRLQPDVVTMDIVMPRRSGIDAVKGIMDIDSTACVVMCSALGQETLVQEALQAGARDFIVKPFKPDSVIATLNKVLEKKEA